MEQKNIFVPGNLRSPAEYFPVPLYFENARWRLVSNAVWIGVQMVGSLTLFAFLGIFLGIPLVFPPSFFFQLLMTGIPALAMAVIFANGSLDLSVGSLAGLVAVVTAQAIVGGVPPLAAVLIGLLVALLFGLFNAAVVGLARVPGFIVTFVVFIAARQLVLIITQGKVIGPCPERTDALPVIAGFIGLIVVGAAFIWAQWPGVNARLANREEKTMGRVRLALPFLVSSLAAGVAGLLLLWRVGYGVTSGGMYLELDCLLVVALAGTCFYGRYVNIVGVLVGTIMFILLQFSLAAANVEPAIITLFTAVLLVLTVGFTYLYHFIVEALYRSASRKKKEAPQA
ncbi:MAG: hypothetical protein JXD23_08780 [Spirochaetales bacterium]|nr:hypothetical protein [Spirochaetales bacterium]